MLGVWWMESQLSRSQTALRRDQWRWEHGLLEGHGTEEDDGGLPMVFQPPSKHNVSP